MAVVPQYIVDANREGSNKINPLLNSTHDPNQDEYKRLMDHAKKQRRRIKRCDEILKEVETETNASLLSETRAKKLKCEEILQSTLEKIRFRQAHKDKIDNREKKKRENRQKIENLEKVRLEKSKLVDYHMKTPEKGEFDGDMTLTKWKRGPGYTDKNPIYVETSSAEIRKEFFAKVNKKTPQRRVTKRLTVAERLALKGQRYHQNNPDDFISRPVKGDFI